MSAVLVGQHGGSQIVSVWCLSVCPVTEHRPAHSLDQFFSSCVEYGAYMPVRRDCGAYCLYWLLGKGVAVHKQELDLAAMHNQLARVDASVDACGRNLW